MLTFDPPYDWVPKLYRALIPFNTCAGMDTQAAGVMGLVDSAEALREGINEGTVRIDWKLPSAGGLADRWQDVRGLLLILGETAARFARTSFTTTMQKRRSGFLVRHIRFSATATFPGDPVGAHAELLRLAQHMAGGKKYKHLESHMEHFEVWSFRAKVATAALARGWKVGVPHVSGRLPFVDTMTRQGTIFVRPRADWAKLLLGVTAGSVRVEKLQYPSGAITVAATDIEGEVHAPT